MTVRLPRRLGEMVAVFVAVAVGATLVTVCLIMGETGWRSAPPAERLSGADLVVGGDQRVQQDEDFDLALPDQVGVPEDLVAKVAAVPGVSKATADVTFPARLHTVGRPVGAPTDTPGHGWDSVAGTVALEGSPPRADDVVVTKEAARAAKVSIGDHVGVGASGATRSMRVSGIVDLPGEDVFVTQSLARQLASRPEGTVDLVVARTAPGVSVDEVAARVRALAGPQVVSTGDDIGRAERPADVAGTSELLLVALSGGGALTMLVGFITAGAVSVAVANRSRELALLRAVGATPSQIRSLIARQGTGVALGAVGLGVAAGYLLARWSAGSLVSAGLLAHGQTLSSSPVPAGATALLLIGVVQVAARLGSWRVSRLPATEAVVATTTEPRGAGKVRTRVGLVLLALAAGTLVAPLVTRSEAALISASSGTLVAVIGVALTAPAAVSRIGRRLAPRVAGAERWLAVRNSGSYALRTGAAIAVLALAVGLVLTQVFADTSVRAVTQHELLEGTRADSVVTAPGSGGVLREALSTIAQTSGVDAAVPAVRSTVIRTHSSDGKQKAEQFPMLAVGRGAEQVLDLEVVDGDLARLKGDTVALDSATAWMAGAGIGDRVPFVLPDGTTVRPEVVATYRRGFGFGKVVLPLDAVPGAASGPYDAVLVSGATGRGGTALATSLRNLPALQVGDSTALAARDGQDADRVLNLGFSLVLVGYVLLGVANRLVATTLRRRREWGVLRAVGVTPRQLRAMARTETALVWAGAVGTGLVVSLVPMTVIALGLVGRPWPQGPAWVVGVTVLVAGVVSYGATMLPARHLLRGGAGPVVTG